MDTLAYGEPRKTYRVTGSPCRDTKIAYNPNRGVSGRTFRRLCPLWHVNPQGKGDLRQIGRTDNV